MAYPLEGASYKPNRRFVEEMKQGENEPARPYSQTPPDPVDFTTMPRIENGGFGMLIISKIR
jgi:hypothetical protein